MLRRAAFVGALWAVTAIAQTAGPAKWQNDLSPIAPADWSYDFAAHLLERAGFGGTPEEIQALAKLTPSQAIARIVRFEGITFANRGVCGSADSKYRIQDCR